MRVLVVGSGAREHAIVWKLRFCPEVTAVYAAPGNAGISFLAHTEPVGVDDFDGLVAMAREFRIDLVIVGPEVPLANGLVDRLDIAHIRAFGPTKDAARIESSKIWAKQLMDRHGIPTARWATANTPEEARAHVQDLGIPVVLKADGLAGGKGAVVCRSTEETEDVIREFMLSNIHGDAGQRLVVEEFLEGVELSVFALADGKSVLPLIGARDYKRLGDGDAGPNTGGMGGYAPPRYASAAVLDAVRRTILEPTVSAMAEEGSPYRGMLYAGLMMTDKGPKVLEYNCRFGDPEAQIILPLLKTDMTELMDACIDGTLADKAVEWNEEATCAVVLASGGYPDAPQTGQKIYGLDDIEEGVLAFHGATTVLKTPEQPRGWLRRWGRELTDADVGFVTTGGRVLTVVARGSTLTQARAKAYANVERISFEGMQFRRDIGEIDPLSVTMGSDGLAIDRPRPATVGGGAQAPTRDAGSTQRSMEDPGIMQPSGASDAGSGATSPSAPASATGQSSATTGVAPTVPGTSLVAILMGSESDRPIMDETTKILNSLGVPHEVHVMSAHRTPERVREFSRSAASRGVEVIIAGAGGAAHLPGVIAAQTIIPVIGVPIPGSSMMGLDSLLSIVQMPGGVPVATVATGNAGARNAAYLAAAILSLAHEDVRARYRQFRSDQSGGELS